jgi:hypothetical protein
MGGGGKKCPKLRYVIYGPPFNKLFIRNTIDVTSIRDHNVTVIRFLQGYDCVLKMIEKIYKWFLQKRRFDFFPKTIFAMVKFPMDILSMDIFPITQ